MTTTPAADPVVFLGPTLPLDAAPITTAEFRPPAAIGDVYRAARAGVTQLLIIDGFFDSVPAVWHKEILYALDRGVQVAGCSSMGALRAAELHHFGMVGTGQIFEMYVDGTLDDDDEVAVAHTSAESGYRAVSHALVNIRYGLSLAADRGLISAGTMTTLVTVAKRLYYADRHWSTVTEAGRAAGLPGDELDRLLAFVHAERPDLKRRDAAEALRALAAGTLTRNARAGSELLVKTHAWRQFERREGS